MQIAYFDGNFLAQQSSIEFTSKTFHLLNETKLIRLLKIIKNVLKSILNKNTFIYIEDLLLEKLIGYERKLSFSFEIDEY